MGIPTTSTGNCGFPVDIFQAFLCRFLHGRLAPQGTRRWHLLSILLWMRSLHSESLHPNWWKLSKRIRIALWSEAAGALSARHTKIRQERSFVSLRVGRIIPLFLQTIPLETRHKEWKRYESYRNCQMCGRLGYKRSKVRKPWKHWCFADFVQLHEQSESKLYDCGELQPRSEKD